ncbi:ThiFdomain/MoeZ/MoeB domain protein [Myxococcus xanthus DK 1622]|uniref:ThiFdomain/MoeZ/MoeB domain protein n=2 Tax=Myxococcus TaxID=32 RepID=Q1D526_MYXXD|nr:MULTISPECIES: HesA/MoeB/ThiF family protein [Myxococcus]ABF92397.1 ThiFdomain/MoeZ/MoeB domain protein [Myxococcus xanthus DK 1622]NOJ51505.1 HesA/MoeB/ThiF family protein [Myxococcus xanthus]QPM76688.1 HesA/MoeB/ThiF family protein [Myxococcus xanthus]QVW65753.1 HesA/MoeB/ThiF family protein [Myxococcus xanthus DZ2]QZZ51759.1 Molybdopterin-synthase adenylyltransferase [Myxococcus xanthus]
MHGHGTDHHPRIPHASRLERARVLLVGAGGLGCPASLALAQAGVGHLTLADPDCVDVTNLPRQLWHRGEDVGRNKAESATAGLARAFPGLSTEAIPERVDASNAEGLFRAHDAVIDATDGVATKFFLSDVAVLTGVPLIYGGVLRMQGQAMRVDPGGPCLRCLYEAPPPPDAVPTCAQAGVLGSLAGLVGAVQALLALELLSGAARGGQGEATLHVLDAVSILGRRTRVARAPDCEGCRVTAIPAYPESPEACAT